MGPGAQRGRQEGASLVTIWQRIDSAGCGYTTKSGDAEGGLVDVKIGPVDQNGLMQYGRKFGAAGTYRVYCQCLEAGPSVHPGGVDTGDAWHGAQTGFRTGWQSSVGSVMAAGDCLRNDDEPGST